MTALQSLNPLTWNLRTFTRVMLVVQAVLLVVRFDPELATNGDNARYYLLGRALAGGDGFRVIEHPQQPLERQLPPGFPALLALSGAAAGGPVAAKTLVAVLGLLATYLLSRVCKRSAPGVARIVVALSALNPLILDYSTIIMSEVPFLCALLLALLALNRYERSPGTGALLAAIAASILPVAMRGAGIAFCAAYLLHALLGRRWGLAAGHAALYAVYLGLLRLLHGPGSSYLTSLVQLDPYAPSAGTASLGAMGRRAIENLSAYAAHDLAEALTPGVLGAHPYVQTAASLVLALLAVASALAALRSPLRLVSLFLLVYAAMLLGWPTQWAGTRFLVPVVPLLYLVILAGVTPLRDALAEAVRRIRRPRPTAVPGREWLPAALGAALALSLVPALARNPVSPLTPDWQTYYDCSDWLRTHTAPGSTVMCRSPALSYLRSEQPSLLYPFTTNADSMMLALRDQKVRYIILDSFRWSGTSFRYVFPVLRAYPLHFRRVYSTAEPVAVVLEVLWP
jgi:hypothetical protein